MHIYDKDFTQTELPMTKQAILKKRINIHHTYKARTYS